LSAGFRATLPGVFRKLLAGSVLVFDLPNISCSGQKRGGLSALGESYPTVFWPAGVSSQIPLLPLIFAVGQVMTELQRICMSVTNENSYLFVIHICNNIDVGVCKSDIYTKGNEC
jgi:hypothetical protein